MGLPLAIQPASLIGGASGDESVALDMESKPHTDELFEILTRDARVPLA